MGRTRAALIWAVLGAVVVVPIAAAAASPLLAWRSPIYIAATFAGILALVFLLFQPLLAGGYLPRISAQHSRRVHRGLGGAVVGAVILHVVALWITSPPDALDALLFRAPTLFSVWGVLAMWTVFAAALVAAFRRQTALRPRTWRLVHTTLATATVLLTVAHVIPVEGAMETATKAVLSTIAILATLKAGADLRIWTAFSRNRS